MALPVRKSYTGNGVSTTLTSSPTAGDTTFTVAAVTGWPTSYPFYIVVDPGTSKEEKMRVTGVSSLTVTVVRGQDDTTAVAHSSGATTYPVFTADEADEANRIASAMTTKGDLIVTDGSDINRLAVGTNAHVLQADSAVTNGVKWGQVATAGIADSAVTEAKIASGAVTETKIGTGAVTSAKIAADAVGSTEIASNAVGTTEIADAAVTPAKLSDTLPLGVVNEIKTVTSDWTTSGAVITGTQMNSYTYLSGRVYRFSWVAQGSSTSGSLNGVVEIRLYDGTNSYGIMTVTVPAIGSMPVSSSYVFVPSSDTTAQFRLYVTFANARITANSSTPLQFWVEDLGKL